MIDRTVRAFVRARAEERCEYCLLPQDLVPLVRFHVEHILPRKHGGSDDTDNLALACFHCNLHKGPNLTGIDPESGDIVALFDPRRAIWEEHFAQDGVFIVGLTPTGRATVRVMSMNAPTRIELRTELRGA